MQDQIKRVSEIKCALTYLYNYTEINKNSAKQTKELEREYFLLTGKYPNPTNFKELKEK